MAAARAHLVPRSLWTRACHCRIRRLPAREAACCLFLIRWVSSQTSESVPSCHCHATGSEPRNGQRASSGLSDLECTGVLMRRNLEHRRDKVRGHQDLVTVLVALTAP
jgi:hypothetical protein